MVLSTPTLNAERITVDDDIVRYRLLCDQCEDWHYHGPQGGPDGATHEPPIYILQIPIVPILLIEIVCELRLRGVMPSLNPDRRVDPKISSSLF